MPVLEFEIQWKNDKSSLNSALNDASKATDRYTKSTVTNSAATKKAAKAERERVDEIRRQLTVTETAFKLGEQSQEQTLRDIALIRQQAKQMDVLNDNTKRQAALDRALANAQLRVQNNFRSMSGAGRQANLALTQIGRLVQDLPFGFLGLSNNIDGAAVSLRSLGTAAKNEGVSPLRLLLKQIMSPAGLIFAVGSLLPAAILIYQNGMNMFARSTSKASEEAKELRDVGRELNDVLRNEESILDRVNREIDTYQKALTLMTQKKILDDKIAQSQVRHRGELVNIYEKTTAEMKAERSGLEQLLALYGIEADSIDEVQEKLTALNEAQRAASGAFGTTETKLASLVDMITGEAQTAITRYEIGVDQTSLSIHQMQRWIEDLLPRWRQLAREGHTQYIPAIKAIMGALDDLNDSFPQMGTLSLDTQTPEPLGLDQEIWQQEKEFYKQFQEELTQSFLNEQNRRDKAARDSARAQLQIERQKTQNILALNKMAGETAGLVLEAAFGQTKAVRVAQTLIDTYTAAQAAYASQLIPGDPSSLIRAKIAAGLAIASGLARVAIIQRIEPGSSGGGGDAGGQRTGFFTDSRSDRREGRRDTGADRVSAFDFFGASNEPILNVEFAGDFDEEAMAIKVRSGNLKIKSKSLSVG